VTPAMNHLRVALFFKGTMLDANPYIALAFPTPVTALAFYRDADLDGYHGDIGQLEFSVASEEAGEMLCSRFWENDATLATNVTCFCGECERNNIPLATTQRSDQIHVRELLAQLGLR
jgi:hypothetical protein